MESDDTKTDQLSECDKTVDTKLDQTENTSKDKSSNEQQNSIENSKSDEKISDQQEESIKSPENTKNPSKSDSVDQNSSPSSGDYSKYVTYNAAGVAIYTDPATSCQYQFDTEKNDWVPLMENEFYKWDSENNKWIPKDNVIEGDNRTYTDADGTVFFWDDEKNAWFPKIDEEFMAHYQLSYGFVDNTNNASESNDATAKANETDKPTATGKRKQPEWFDLPPEQNTKVYVDNLPTNITEQEFIDLMSKCGMICKDPINGKLKVKLYAESNGQLKGDGLCDYIRVESVELALNLLDGYDYRGHKLKVQRAKFEMRGVYNPALKPKKKKADKEKAKKLKEKLLDWRPEKLRGERSKHERVVNIKNLFTPALFDKEVHLVLDYQRDLREECSKCGTVRKVIIFDRHPDGVAQVVMGDPEEADLVIQMMNRRFFGSRQLTAETWDGKEKFKIDESSTEESKRLENWDQYLETDDNNEGQQMKKADNETT